MTYNELLVRIDALYNDVRTVCNSEKVFIRHSITKGQGMVLYKYAVAKFIKVGANGPASCKAYKSFYDYVFGRNNEKDKS